MSSILRIAMMLSLSLAVFMATGCTPLFPCGIPLTLRDCRSFGALQHDDEPPEPKKPMIICRDANRHSYSIEADACPKGDAMIG